MTATGDRRRSQILQAGLDMARSTGLDHITARAIGLRLRISHTAVYYHFPEIDGLRTAIAEYAVSSNDAPMIARLILDRHSAVALFSSEQRTAFLEKAASR